jgi:hypothetical protein
VVDRLVGRLVPRPVLVITSAVLNRSFRGGRCIKVVGWVGGRVTGVTRLEVAVADVAVASVAVAWL